MAFSMDELQREDGLPFDPDWLVEAGKRAARIDSGANKLSSWEEVRARARQSLGEDGV